MKRVEIIHDEFYIMTDDNNNSYIYEDKKTWLAHYVILRKEFLDAIIKKIETIGTFKGREELIRGFKGLPCALRDVDIEEFFANHDAGYTWTIADYVKRKKK